MKSIKNYFTWMLLLVMIFTACKNAGNNDSKLLVEKKAQLQKLTAEKNKLDESIKKLQDEINLLDTNSSKQSKFTLVAVTPVAVQKFDHYIDLRGRIDAENISYISPRGMGGQVKEIFVREGVILTGSGLLTETLTRVRGKLSQPFAPTSLT